MLINPTNTLQKTYQQLHLLLANDSLEAAWFDQLAGQWTRYEKATFSPIEQPLLRALKYRELLTQWELNLPIWDSVRLVHQNPLVTFVPSALYDENYAGYYLQYHQGVLETDPFTHQLLEKQDMVGVYIPQIGLEEHLGLNAPKRQHEHAHVILVERLLNRSKNNDDRTMYVHLTGADRFEIIVVHNQKLLFYNAFTYKSPVDFIYYLLFTAEQLQLNPEHFPLHFVGAVSRESEVYQMAYTYVRHVDLLEIEEFPTASSWSANQTAEAYLLLI